MTIKNFSWNYVGWVDLENVGFEGIPIDQRLHTPEYLATAMTTAEDFARLMDGLGYDALYGTEHHFQPEGVEVLPNLLLLATHLASITKNLRFGCAFNILPQWHPLRLAEDYAMADILTRGRVIFGIGRGTQVREAETFGAPMLDQERNRDLVEEQIEILMKAFHQERFSHQGEFYTIPPAVPFRGKVLQDVTLVPKPLYSTEIWQPVTSRKLRGLRVMARHKIKGVMHMLELGPEPDPVAVTYRDLRAEHGDELELGEDLAVYLYTHLSTDRRAATAEVEKFQEESFKRTAGIGGNPTEQKRGEAFSSTQLAALGDPVTARATAKQLGYQSLWERSETDKTFLMDNPENVIATLKKLEERYPGLETVILHPPELVHKPIFAEQIERFAKEVMPAFPEARHAGRIWPDKLSDPAAITRYQGKPPQGSSLHASA